MDNDIGIIIPIASQNRKNAFISNIKHLIKYINDPFTIYVYNDQVGIPLKPLLCPFAKNNNKCNIKVLNDKQELSSKRIGCGGTRYYLFEEAKAKHNIIISLDDDMQIKPNWYPAIKKAIKYFPNHSIFTSTCINKPCNTKIAGLNVKIENSYFTRHVITSITEEFQQADFGPIGCLVLCRKALKPNIKFPKDLIIMEDAEFFLQLFKLNINKTIVATKGIIVHKSVISPEIPNFRTKENLSKALRYIWKQYGINAGKNLAGKYGLPKDLKKLQKYIENIS